MPLSLLTPKLGPISGKDSDQVCFREQARVFLEVLGLVFWANLLIRRRCLARRQAQTTFWALLASFQLLLGIGFRTWRRELTPNFLSMPFLVI